MESLIEILLSVIPLFQHLADQAEILISVIPQFLAGLPIWLYGVIGMVSLYISWEFLEGKI